MDERSNWELAFFDTLMDRNKKKISVLVYGNPTNTEYYLHYSSYKQTNCKENVVSTLLIRPAARTLKKVKTTGGELWKLTRPLGLMLKAMFDQPLVAKNTAYGSLFYGIVLDFG